MLEQVRKAGLAGLLVARTDLVVDVDERLRRGAVDVQQHGQAVIEHVTFVGNIDAREVLRSSGQGKQGGQQQRRCDSFDHL